MLVSPHCSRPFYSDCNADSASRDLEFAVTVRISWNVKYTLRHRSYECQDVAGNANGRLQLTLQRFQGERKPASNAAHLVEAVCCRATVFVWSPGELCDTATMATPHNSTVRTASYNSQRQIPHVGKCLQTAEVKALAAHL